MGVHDDPRGIGITMGVPPGTPPIVHLLASTPFLVVVLNAVVAGAIVAVALVAFVDPDPPAAAVVVAALVAAVVILLAQMNAAARRVRQGQEQIRPLFPTPGAPGTVTRILGTDIPDFTNRSGDPEG
jgi:hypothetical protein